MIFSVLLKQQQNVLKTNQTNGAGDEVMKQLNKMQRQVNPFAKSHK
jgi:hypothetical protein